MRIVEIHKVCIQKALVQNKLKRSHVVGAEFYVIAKGNIFQEFQA